jgi:predicted RNA polymerase sigma factor
VANTSQTLEQFVRNESGRLVASLTRQLGNFDLAEESVQDAILEALGHWPASGPPREPGAWLRVTARRKAIDRMRREARHRDRLQVLGKDMENAGSPTKAGSSTIDWCCSSCVVIRPSPERRRWH